jgi:nicotinamidase-related amidase
MSLEAMVRLATLDATQLLAETRSALLLVDVQNRFLFGANESDAAPTAPVLAPTEKLLSTARASEIPRYFVTVGHASGFADAGPWLRRLADMGADVTARLRMPPLSPWASAIPSAIAPQPGEVHLTKWRFSAFYETGLEILLRGAGIETLVIGGVASYGCIIATYLDACSRGFFPLLCTEAVDGAHPALHKAAMDFMTVRSQVGLDDVVRIWSGK